MTTPTPKKRVKRKEAEAVETEPDAWERFTIATRKIVPPRRPKPHTPPKRPKRPAKGVASKGEKRQPA